MQSANGLKARVGAKKADVTAVIFTTKENAVKQILVKGLQKLWILTFLSTLYILMDLKKI